MSRKNWGVYDQTRRGKLISRHSSRDEADAAIREMMSRDPEIKAGDLRVMEIRPRTKYVGTPGVPWKFV